MRTSDSDTDGPLTYSANLNCPECDELFEGIWTDDSIDAEQVVDPPVNTQHCPTCAHSWDQEYPGFINYGDAG